MMTPMLSKSVVVDRRGLVSVFLTAVLFWALSLWLLNGSPAWGFPGQEKILDSGLVDQAAKSIRPVGVIVTPRGAEDVYHLKGGGQQIKAIRMKTARMQDAVVSKMAPGGGETGLRLENVPVMSASVNYEGIKSLAGMNEVLYIEEDLPMELMTSQGLSLMKPGSYRDGNAGAGVSVAIVDTGVNYRHPALGSSGFPNSKVLGGMDFGDGDRDPMDMQGHGSSCAGIVAGKNTGAGDFIGGVAPSAGIYALKAMDSEGGIRESAILKSWDWCISHQHDHPDRPIMVISTSLGTPTMHFENYCNRRGAASVAEAAKAAGIAIFVSSGNEAQRGRISYTACLPQTIAVGAVYDGRFGSARFSRCSDRATNPDQVTCYSNSAPILDLLAPSHQAYTAGWPGSKYETAFGGTSAACPYAAGVAALIQSHVHRNTGRFLSVDQLKAVMVQNGDPVRDAKSGITKPRVNIERTLAALGGGREDRREEDRREERGNPIDELRDILRRSSN